MRPPLSSSWLSPPERELWGNRDFNVFWAGQALSVFGDACAMVATPLLVLQATGSVLKMGLLTATMGVGSLGAGLISGVVVDRMDRRRLMIACDCIRMLLWAAIPGVWWLFGPTLWVLFAVAFLSACFGNTFQVACISALANLVRRDQIIHANGRLHGSYAFMNVTGPMLAGILCHSLGAVSAIAVNAGSFALSAASLMFVQLRPSEAAAARSTARGTLGELLAGVRFIAQEPILRAVTVLLGCASLLYGARNDVLIFHLKHTLHRNDSEVGLFFGLASVGAVLGAVLAPRARQLWGFGGFWLTCGFILGAAILGIGVVSGFAMALAMAMVMTYADTARGVVAQTFRQEVTPDPLLGRVTAAFWTLLNAPAPLGAALTTSLAARAGSSFALTAMGLGGMTLAFMGLFTALRSQAAVRGDTAPIRHLDVETPLPPEA